MFLSDLTTAKRRLRVVSYSPTKGLKGGYLDVQVRDSPGLFVLQPRLYNIIQPPLTRWKLGTKELIVGLNVLTGA